jgi:hypothetical protein
MIHDLSGRRSKPLPQLQSTIVPTNIVPVEQPLAKPYTEIKGVGGGFVQYYSPFASERGLLSEHVKKVSDESYASERMRKGDQFENANLYANLARKLKETEPVVH